MTKPRTAVVDGANVAYIEQSAEGKPKVSNLVAVYQALKDKGYDPIIIIDATLHHNVDDPQQLEALLEQQKVRQAPAGTDADFFVLDTAERFDAIVVTNDRYEDYLDRFPWFEERRVPVMIVRGKVELYEPDLS